MQSSKQIGLGKGSPVKAGLISVKSMSFLQILPRKQCIKTMNAQHYQKHRLVFENEKLQSEVEIMDWRMKTQFPIAKIMSYTILQKNVKSSRSLVQLTIQTFPFSFQSMPKLLLSEILNIMKEAMIGFERLYVRFGNFDINDKMIFLNKNSQCRVWFHQNLALNYPASRQATTQKDMLFQMIKIFQQKCIKSTISIQFFPELYQVIKIVSAIQMIDSLSKSNKPDFLNKISFISLTKSINFEKEPSKKVPSFIMKSKQQKKLYENLEYLQSGITKDNWYLHTNLPQPNISVRTATPSKTIASKNSNDTKPNNPTFLGWSVRHSKNLTKQISHDQFQGFASMQISKFKNHNNLKQKKETNEIAEDLYFTKIPIFQNSKIRKFSFTDKNMIMQCQLPTNKLIYNEGQKNNELSQQTNTTGQYYRQEKHFGNANQLIPIINIIKFIDQEEKSDLYKKNGWVKRLKTLGNARQTICSRCDGDEILSENLRYESEDLFLLGKMGGQLQTSIICPDTISS